ncbi:hypothetical protein TNIN_315901 [Trichonephila inaurata madagascariensis]|uniref:Uncharacterized protein n=1 Tax=Trichonephila inaurata madagascariensis TaxID=2747483 RepID=A0A8X7CEF8_9ARAC|nr:hypothetical protein TNIN_315901 [Trichonephila inaurata madagascariensis]
MNPWKNHRVVRYMYLMNCDYNTSTKKKDSSKYVRRRRYFNSITIARPLFDSDNTENSYRAVPLQFSSRSEKAIGRKKVDLGA